jgi:hypothetical protein
MLGGSVGSAKKKKQMGHSNELCLDGTTWNRDYNP